MIQDVHIATITNLAAMLGQCQQEKEDVEAALHREQEAVQFLSAEHIRLKSRIKSLEQQVVQQPPLDDGDGGPRSVPTIHDYEGSPAGCVDEVPRHDDGSPVDIGS